MLTGPRRPAIDISSTYNHRFADSTRSLGITPSTTSDNLTPQETTDDGSGTVGADGAGLSCAGSRVVAVNGQDSELEPLIKSPVEAPPQDTQQVELSAKEEDS